ncbi:hypothetical protein [Avibacterium endocarditidis]|uniref:hypothetical protein n=1 Tax=Avibacterium TaxID=292486 RepID=UPI0039FC67D7
MKLICPQCKKKNNIEYAKNITCEKCHQSFEGYTYKIKRISKPLVITCLIAGGVTSQTIEEIWEQNRYPVKQEYAVIATCASSVRGSYPKKSIDICICALEKTMNDVEDYTDNYAVRSSLSKNLESCK